MEKLLKMVLLIGKIPSRKLIFKNCDFKLGSLTQYDNILIIIIYILHNYYIIIIISQHKVTDLLLSQHNNHEDQ